MSNNLPNNNTGTESKGNGQTLSFLDENQAISFPSEEYPLADYLRDFRRFDNELLLSSSGEGL